MSRSSGDNGIENQILGGEHMVTVTIHGEKREFAQGTSYETIAADYQKEYDGMIALVSVNGKIREQLSDVQKEA